MELLIFIFAVPFCIYGVGYSTGYATGVIIAPVVSSINGLIDKDEICKQNKEAELKAQYDFEYYHFYNKMSVSYSKTKPFI